MGTKNRTLVIGDIHGGLKALKQVFERAHISEKDTLIFLGDYVDGWSDSAAVISYLIALNKTHTCIFIKGNHDYLLQRYLCNNDQNELWLRHGGASTLLSYKDISENTKKEHILFLEGLQNYYIDSKNRLFIHAGFTHLAGPEYEWNSDFVFWDRTLWETVCAMDVTLPKKSELYPKRLLAFKEIYIGHTPTTRIGKAVPVNFANVWNIDTGAAFKGKLSLLDVETKRYWQSNAVWQFYTEEKGRN